MAGSEDFYILVFVHEIRLDLSIVDHQPSSMNPAARLALLLSTIFESLSTNWQDFLYLL